ncbi:MAG: hypothetical protein ACK41W_10975 [Cyanobacteriota bacterium]|jgi:hypothetical protein
MAFRTPGVERWRALAIATALAHQEPADLERLRHRAVAHAMVVGDAFFARGDSTQARLDPTIGQNKVGDALRGRCDTAAAQAAFQAGLEISEQPVRRDPDNGPWSSGRAFSFERLGAALRQKDPTAALSHDQRALANHHALVVRDPVPSPWLWEWLVSHLTASSDGKW